MQRKKAKKSTDNKEWWMGELKENSQPGIMEQPCVWFIYLWHEILLHLLESFGSYTHSCTLALSVGGEETGRQGGDRLRNLLSGLGTHILPSPPAHVHAWYWLPLSQCVLLTHPVPSCTLSHSPICSCFETSSADNHFYSVWQKVSVRRSPTCQTIHYEPL